MREKPTCKRCGLPHWMFVPCAELEAQTALEERKDALKVIPVWRTGPDRELIDPNVFFHKRPR